MNNGFILGDPVVHVDDGKIHLSGETEKGSLPLQLCNVKCMNSSILIHSFFGIKIWVSVLCSTTVITRGIPQKQYKSLMVSPVNTQG